jgi:hypothetical protein
MTFKQKNISVLPLVQDRMDIFRDMIAALKILRMMLKVQQEINMKQHYQ